MHSIHFYIGSTIMLTNLNTILFFHLCTQVDGTYVIIQLESNASKLKRVDIFLMKYTTPFLFISPFGRFI